MYRNISAYQFISLDRLDSLRLELKEKAQAHHLIGTIILAPEGINLNLAGKEDEAEAFMVYLVDRLGLVNLPIKRSDSTEQPFQKLKVKLKREIITFRDDSVVPLENVVPHLKPEELKAWLDEGRDIIVLDTRNDYETEVGHFENAVYLPIENFTDLTQAVEEHFSDEDKQKPMVTYCTGGVRCEKAGTAMERLGFKEVYQLDGGILNYFERCGGAHWTGNCFVFDDRHAVTPQLEEAALGEKE